MKNKIQLNKIYNEDCLDTMKRMKSNSIDLTVTSPPYDNLRSYKGYKFEFKKIARELFRVTKEGGVVVWVVNDQKVDGSETGTSFRQALYFKKIGFNIHDTMIWEKTGSGAIGGTSFQYLQNFEFTFVFSKGGKPKTFNPIEDRPNVIKFGKVQTNARINQDGKSTESRQIQRKPFGRRTNIWKIAPQQNTNHPAPFPIQLASDHIKSWSNKGDTVYDPLTGSGTTLLASKLLSRNFIGSEIAEDYYKIALERVRDPQFMKELVNRPKKDNSFI